MSKNFKPKYPQQLKALIEEGKNFSEGATIYGIELTWLTAIELRSLLAITLAGVEVRRLETADELAAKYAGNGEPKPE